jgi:ferredoxin-nitrite reductase
MAQDRRYGTGERGPLPPEPTWEQVLERNAIERLKLEKAPAAIVDELGDLGRRPYLDIPEEDIVRLRWYGLYHDKPKVGEFMLRIKLPAGRLTADGLRLIGELSEGQGKDYAELTTRQNVQLHFLRLGEVPAILARLSGIGITTAGACGDAVRNITGCPLSGVLAGEAFDVGPVVDAAAELFYANPAYMNLPRKHKITISACPAQCDMPEINCIAFIAVRGDEPGFAVRVGGGLSTAPRLARDLGVFVPFDDALPVMRAIVDVWNEDRRYRLSRVKARMKFMVDDYGAEGMRAKVEERLGRSLGDGKAPAAGPAADHMGVHEQKQPGLYHVGVPVPVGIARGEQLIAIAELIRASAGADARITKQQNLILTNVPEARVDDVVAGLAAIGFPVDANPLHATAIACTGEPHCNFAVTETKGRMQTIVAHLEERWGTRLGGFRLNLDGCPHACALHWVGDIGLMGTTARQAVDGDKRAFDLFLRGGTGPLEAVGRPLVRRVPFPRVEAALDRLIEAWLDERGDGDLPFRDFCIERSDDELVSIAHGGEIA